MDRSQRGAYAERADDTSSERISKSNSAARTALQQLTEKEMNEYPYQMRQANHRMTPLECYQPARRQKGLSPCCVTNAAASRLGTSVYSASNTSAEYASHLDTVNDAQGRSICWPPKERSDQWTTIATGTPKIQQSLPEDGVLLMRKVPPVCKGTRTLMDGKVPPLGKLLLVCKGTRTQMLPDPTRIPRTHPSYMLRY